MSHHYPPAFAPDNQAFIPSGNTHKRKGLFSWIFKLLVSPTSAFVFAFLGYYSLAGFTNLFLPEGSLGGILIRVLTLGILTFAFLRQNKKYVTHTRFFMLPVTLFFIIYFFRLFENFYISNMNFMAGPFMIFLFYLSGIFATLILVRMAHMIRDDHFMILASAMCFIFLIGMVSNLDTLMASAHSRMELDKINPISLAYLAASFLIYYFLFFSKSKRLTIEAMIIVPILLLIIVYARSRGAYVVNIAALGVYILLLKGTKRIWTIVAILAGGFVFLTFFGGEILDVVWKRLENLTSTENDESTRLHVLAWEGAWQQFLDNPAFGRYAIELQTRFYPHNIYLDSLMSIGVFGSVPLAFHFGLATRAAIGLIRSPHYPLVATFIAVLFLREALAGAGSGSLFDNPGLWITSSLAIALWYGRQRPIAPKLSHSPPQF